MSIYLRELEECPTSVMLCEYDCDSDSYVCESEFGVCEECCC